MAKTSLADRAVSAGDLKLAGDISRAMMKFFRATHHFKNRMASEHVDQTTFMLLSVLAELGPLRSTLLASRLHSDPSTISRQAAHLVQQGLVVRTADPEDGRASLLAVTDAGRAELATARASRDRMLAGLIEDWTLTDRQRLASLLDRLAQDMTNSDPDRAATTTQTENS